MMRAYCCVLVRAVEFPRDSIRRFFRIQQRDRGSSSSSHVVDMDLKSTGTAASWNTNMRRISTGRRSWSQIHSNSNNSNKNRGNADDLASILAKVAAGTLSPSAGTQALAPLLVSGGARAENVGGYAKIDHDRRRRTGFPEVVFGEGKSAEQIAEIFLAMVRNRDASSRLERESTPVTESPMVESPIVATRVSPEKWAAISATGLLSAGEARATYHADARIVSIGGPRPAGPIGHTRGGTELNEKAESSGFRRRHTIGKVAVMSAGTSDLCVAEEAAVLAELSGAEVVRFHDVGVAGIHRLLSAIPEVEEAGVAICVAGMDGAMPGVIAGLVKCPVVAVPTSVGYGAAMSGLAPLLTMLNACAPGVSVVNIDNGFGAAAFAIKLLNSGNESVRRRGSAPRDRALAGM